MKVAVTGVVGNVGRHVARELASHGHEVVGLDLRDPAPDQRLSAFHMIDMQDGAAVAAAFAGCEAVVHLAGISRPGLVPDREMFQINMMGTYNALEAAVMAGASRFCLASSEATLGFTTLAADAHPEYLPIDEEHPVQARDSYGLTKLLGEEMCRSYAERGALTTVCLRTSYVWSLEWRENAIDGLVNEDRTRRSLWTYVDARDAAVAYRLACEATGITHEVLFVAAKDSGTVGSVVEYLATHHPNADGRERIGPTDSVISSDRAHLVLGFEPQYSWRDQLTPAEIAAGQA